MTQQQLDLETNINQAYNDAKGAFFYEAAKKTAIGIPTMCTKAL